jgi:hypothetical protein
MGVRRATRSVSTQDSTRPARKASESTADLAVSDIEETTVMIASELAAWCCVLTEAGCG